VLWRGSEKVKFTRNLAKQGKCCPEHMYAKVEDVHLRDGDRAVLAKGEQTCAENIANWISIRPDASQYEIEGAKRRFKTIWHAEWDTYIQKNSTELFGKGRVLASCLLHPGMLCPIRWEDSRVGIERSLVVGVGGPHCVPYCRGGGKKGQSHDAMKPWCCFKGEHSSGILDVSLVEQSADMPPGAYAEPMRPKHDVKYVICGDEALGGAIARTRFYGAGLNRRSLIWVGPEGEDMTGDFLKFFQRRAAFECDAYVGKDTLENIELTRNAYAKRRGYDNAYGYSTGISSAHQARYLMMRMGIRPGNSSAQQARHFMMAIML
jgi:hypothetical protein